jgi:hypothetical protein
MAPGIPVGQSYDAMKILSLLLKEKRNDTLIAMKDFKKYNGVSGELTITEDGRTNLPTALFQVNNGKISRIKELR